MVYVWPMPHCAFLLQPISTQSACHTGSVEGCSAGSHAGCSVERSNQPKGLEVSATSEVGRSAAIWMHKHGNELR